MTGPISMTELDKLLDRVRHGGAKYGAEAYADGIAARSAIVHQVAELAQLLTPAEGGPLEVARAKLRARFPRAKPDAIDAFARELVGALGLFARPGAE